MESSKLVENSKIEKFWVDYFTTLKLFRIPERSHIWYRKKRNFVDTHLLKLDSTTDQG